MILITLVTCLLFNSIYALVYVPFYGGDFYYFDKNGELKENSFNVQSYFFGLLAYIFVFNFIWIVYYCTKVAISV